MSKMSDLQAVLSQGKSSKVPDAPERKVIPALEATSPVKAQSRDGKTHIGAYLSRDFKRSMRLVQAETGEDTQTLIARALNELFRAHNVPVIDG